MRGSDSGFDPSPRRGAPRWTLLALAGIAVVALAFHARSAADIVRGLLSTAPEARFPFEVDPEAPLLGTIQPEAKAAGLAAGDVPVRLGRIPYLGTATPWEAMRSLRPGDVLEVVYTRPGSPEPARERTAFVRLEGETRSGGSRLGAGLLALFVNVAIPVFGVALGLWTAAVRPLDRRAWLLLGLMLSFGQVMRTNFASWEPGVREAGAAYSVALGRSWPIFMILFGLYFPEPFQAEQRRPWLKWIPISVLAASGLLQTVGAVGSLTHQAAMAPVWAVQHAVQWPALVLVLASVGSFFASLAMKTAFATSPDSKRRLRLLRAGTTVALTPLFLVFLYSIALRAKGMEVPPAVVVPTLLLVFLFPATLAYVIVVQRAMDVRGVLRMGVRYLVVRNGLRLMVFLGMLPVGWLVFQVLLPARVGVLWKAAGVAGLIAVIFLVKRRVNRAMLAIDRRFFRDAYNEEHVLTELGEQVRTIVEAGPLLETVCGKIDDALHVGRIAVLLEENGAYAVAHGRGLPEGPPPRIPAGSRTASALRAARGAVGVYFDDPTSWVHRDGGLPAEERIALEALGTQVLLPLDARGELLGMISLGPKLSEQPYSRVDLRLLRNVATQAGLALENCRLTSAIVAETAKRARLDREIEIARDVQRRLFPQRIPELPGLDCAGACRPASGVGGDYYDFLALDGGELGIAIADVSGKGIPAALLMASLQASLRGQTMDGGRDLAGLMARVNRLVHDASPENRYATFFYGQYDPATRRLGYVNAGHNAPFLVRGDGSEVLRLKEGGMVVGLMRDATFSEGSVLLRGGDVLVAYTDGISEAMNAGDEEWGEERLLRAVLAAGGGLPASRLVERLFEGADAFVAGAPQHDDMTLVVVRVLPG